MRFYDWDGFGNSPVPQWQSDMPFHRVYQVSTRCVNSGKIWDIMEFLNNERAKGRMNWDDLPDDLESVNVE